MQTVGTTMQSQAIRTIRSARFLEVARSSDAGSVYDRLARACRSLDAPGAARAFAPDARIVTGRGENLCGREAILGWLTWLFGRAAARGVDLDMRFHVGEHGVQNGVVFDVGSFVLTARDRDGVRVPLEAGRFLVVCRRGVDGRSCIVRLGVAHPHA
jgi:ketosteroid isomerase-like protein